VDARALLAARVHRRRSSSTPGAPRPRRTTPVLGVASRVADARVGRSGVARAEALDQSGRTERALLAPSCARAVDWGVEDGEARHSCPIVGFSSVARPHEEIPAVRRASVNGRGPRREASCPPLRFAPEASAKAGPRRGRERRTSDPDTSRAAGATVRGALDGQGLCSSFEGVHRKGFSLPHVHPSRPPGTIALRGGSLPFSRSAR